MGYIFPLYATFMILDNNDYSDSFLVKIKLEFKEFKSEYAYYALANNDYSIENISSSAINLGLTLDLLKKYVVKIDILIRNQNDKVFNIWDNYGEEPKKIIWVFPDIIYPKDNIQQNKKMKIEELLKKSKRKEYYVKIIILKFNENKNIVLLFRFTEINFTKINKKLTNKSFLPKYNKYLIMFDLLKLCYIRTIVVDVKSGFNNLMSKDNFEDIEKNKTQNYRLNMKRNKRRELILSNNEDASSENSDKNKNVLTKEKLIELQVHNYSDIKAFIASLPIYGKDVNLERFRPNGDKYSVGKIPESLIKINMSIFCKNMEKKFHLEQNLRRPKKNINLDNNNKTHIDSPKSSSTNNYLFSSKGAISDSKQESYNIEVEEFNRGLTSDSSLTLSNFFKGNSVKYIRIFGRIFFFLTFLLFLNMFLTMYFHMLLIKRKIEFLRNGYLILNHILYIKFYVTEGVLAKALRFYYPSLVFGGKDSFLNKIKQELAFYMQQLTEIYDIFTSNKLCKEFKDFIKNTKITIDTLTINKPEKISIMFNNAINRISSSINDITSNVTLLNIENRSTYELMYNLLNEYYINWENATKILFNNAVNATNLKIPLMIIVITYIFLSLIIIYIFLNLLSKFSLEREKPINLFLTLKKTVFENLKNKAENFSNKILNKFFDIDDEESQQDYKASIQPSDINIAKSKIGIEFNSSIIRAFSFINMIIVIFVFILLNLLYFILSYFDFRNRMKNILSFIFMLDKNNYSQSNLILSVNIFKSFLFNRNIPIFNFDNSEAIFFINLMNLTIKFESSFSYFSNSKAFLNKHYLKIYEKYLYGNFSELLNPEYFKQNSKRIDTYIKFGIKPFETRIFEKIRYFTIKYIISSENNRLSNGISKILMEPEFKLVEINILIENIIRSWYNGILTLMNNYINEYLSNSLYINAFIFICLTIIVIIYYSIIWKRCEEKLNSLLKGSADLINLIPQEIKNIIIQKLKE